MPLQINVKNTALDVCPVLATKCHTRKYARARQHVSRQHKLERKAEQSVVKRTSTPRRRISSAE